MARLRYNGLRGTLGGSLTNSATSVTFSSALTHSNGTAVPTLSGGDYFYLTILDSSGNLSEIVKVTAYTSAGTSATIARGQEGTSGVSHASGDKFVHGPLVTDAGLKDYAEVSLTSGSISLNSTSVTLVSSSLNMSLVADVGDVIGYGLSGLYGNENLSVAMDAYTVVSSSPVNPFGAGLSASLGSTLGNVSWFVAQAGTNPGWTFHVGGEITRVLTSGDISSGTVTLGLYYAKSNTSVRTLNATSSIPLKVWAKNYGPSAY